MGAALRARLAQVYVVMEFVPRNLLELLEEKGGTGLDKRTVQSVIRQLCTAIGYLHESSVLYRDVKPENILIDAGGSLKLCDFGFARKCVLRPARLRLLFRTSAVLLSRRPSQPHLKHVCLGDQCAGAWAIARLRADALLSRSGLRKGTC